MPCQANVRPAVKIVKQHHRTLGLETLQVAKEETSAVASYWVGAELRRLAAEEREWRCRLWSQGAPAPVRTPTLFPPIV